MILSGQAGGAKRRSPDPACVGEMGLFARGLRREARSLLCP